MGGDEEPHRHHADQVERRRRGPRSARGAQSQQSSVFCLLRRLSQRPTAEELKQRNILQGEADRLLPQLPSTPPARAATAAATCCDVTAPRLAS